MPLAAGARLGSYEIVAALGAGGMGEVYRAHDSRLGRDVALKVLPAEFASSPDRLKRFEREARAVAALNHPSIVVLYSIEDAAGTRFLTMELVEGQSLDREVTAGPLAIPRVLEFAIALADALTVAHEKGVIHRDLKPANIMVAADGRLKVLDFGLAKLAEPEGDASRTTALLSSTSEVGGLIGTVPYMAPEQLRGEPVDSRTDLFALGAVLYELISGRRAFDGRTMAEVTSSILRDQPPPLRTSRPDVPSGLDQAVSRCLGKGPAERPASARELAAELREIQRAFERGDLSVGGAQATLAGRPAVAVLPFRDLQRRPENADLGLGLADATITELTLIQSLLVRPTSTILRYQEESISAQAAARQLGVDAVVEGSFQRSGDRLRVTVQLVARADGHPLWGTKIDTSLEDVFRMQDEVSRHIAAALDVRLTPMDEQKLAGASRAAPAGDAFAEYMGGKRHLYRGTLTGVNAAIEHFEKALSIDPRFAAAWAGLGDAYMRMAFEHAPDGDWQSRAKEMCERALALDPDLPEARYVRGRLAWNPAAGFDHARAIRESLGALALRPGLTEARYLLGVVLFHVGLLDESDREFGRILAADPQDLYARAHRGSNRLHQGRYDEALALAEEEVRQVAAPWNLYVLAQSQARLSRLDEAAQTVLRMGREAPDYPEAHALSGLVAALRGDDAGARQEIERTAANRRAFGHYHHAQYDVACIYVRLGELDPALEWLTQSAKNGYPCYSFFESDPLLRPLQAHAGFAPLMRELRAECETYARLYAEVREGVSA